MKSDIENNEWKVEAPYLASLQKVNPFRVPEQYFNTLPDLISNSVYAEQLKTEQPLSGFIVPDQYFNNLRAHILAATTEEISFDLPKEAGYNTPDLYFQKLQANILAKTTAQYVPVRRLTKITRLWHSDLLKYTSAACFILISAFGFYLNQQNFQRETGAAEIANEQMLYDIDEQDIIDHIQGNNMDKQTVSNTDLESYLLNNYSQNELSSAL